MIHELPWWLLMTSYLFGTIGKHHDDPDQSVHTIRNDPTYITKTPFDHLCHCNDHCGEDRIFTFHCQLAVWTYLPITQPIKWCFKGQIVKSNVNIILKQYKNSQSLIKIDCIAKLRENSFVIVSVCFKSIEQTHPILVQSLIGRKMVHSIKSIMKAVIIALIRPNHLVATCWKYDNLHFPANAHYYHEKFQSMHFPTKWHPNFLKKFGIITLTGQIF